MALEKCVMLIRIYKSIFWCWMELDCWIKNVQISTFTNHFPLCPEGEVLLEISHCGLGLGKVFHFKLLHNISPANCIIATFTDIETSCSFCRQNVKTSPQMFFWLQYLKKISDRLCLYCFSSRSIVWIWRILFVSNSSSCVHNSFKTQIL